MADLKQATPVKKMTDTVLNEKLVLLMNNSIIEQTYIEKHKITKGYVITEYGKQAVRSYLPLVKWALNHNRIIKLKAKKP
jgi:hypothetical protein